MGGRRRGKIIVIMIMVIKTESVSDGNEEREGNVNEQEGLKEGGECLGGRGENDSNKDNGNKKRLNL